MSSDRIAVTPAVLIWARESLGLSIEAAAKKLSVSVPTLTEWESGELPPTIKQLRKAAWVYRRPLAVLLLDTPPVDFDPLKDYRAGSLADAQPSPELTIEIRRALGQREVLLELRDFEPDSVPEPTKLPRLSRRMDPEAAGAALRAWTGVDLDDQFAARDKYAALNLWVRPIEQRGVLVVNLDGVDIDEVAGFSISEWPYPIIAVNGSDWPRRRLFTLLHELAHLALNVGGLCDLHEVDEGAGDADQVEHFCNAVAAAALLPPQALAVQPEVQGALDTDTLWQLARRFSVSSEAILLRLVALGIRTWDDYWVLKPDLEALYRDARDREREERRGDSAPIYYQTKARNLGHGYIGSVLDAFDARAISSRDVADYLDIKFDQLGKLADVVGHR